MKLTEEQIAKVMQLVAYSRELLAIGMETLDGEQYQALNPDVLAKALDTHDKLVSVGLITPNQ